MLSSRIVAALAGVALVAACGSGGTGGGDNDPGTSSSGTAQQQPSKVIYLLGQAEAVGAAARLVNGFETRINGTPGPHDVVLFTVTATDGPMPQTREQIEALKGRDYGPAAILLVKTDQQTDEELRQLVIQEMRELLSRSSVPDADNLPVIIGEDPNLRLTLQGLTNQG